MLEKKKVPDGKSISYIYNDEKQKTKSVDYFGNETIYGLFLSSLVEFVRVDDTEFTVVFKDGTEIKV